MNHHASQTDVLIGELNTTRKQPRDQHRRTLHRRALLDTKAWRQLWQGRIPPKDMNTYPCGFRGEENLGKFWDLNLDELDQDAWCKQYDWECFRDPSELIGPLLDLATRPSTLLQRFLRDRKYARLWLEDLRYYRACNYFNATLAPDFRKLSAFRPAV